MTNSQDNILNEEKIILDLCGGTGAWSKPYVDAGYDVRLITLPDNDILTYTPPSHVYGILAAPPCTHFSGSGAQYWKAKDKDGRTKEALEIVDACLKIISDCQPVFWALENPVGRLKRLRYEQLGEPRLIFQPCDYGDPWNKKTLVWGNFNSSLKKTPVIPMDNKNQLNPISQPRDIEGKKVGWHTDLAKELRSVTPPGFAKAFFESNR